MTLEIQRCPECDAHWFPHRLLCPLCGGNRFEPVLVDRGRVESVSETSDGVVLATVRLIGDVPVIARLLGSAQPGDIDIPISTDPRATGPVAYVPQPDQER
jgi:uncharacterized OB-fold protein